MSDEAWRPLGVDDDQTIAEYDALHDGLPAWLESAYWSWVRHALSTVVRSTYNSWHALDTGFTQSMCQTLKIPLPAYGSSAREEYSANTVLGAAITHLKAHPKPLQIADYILAYGTGVAAGELDKVLERGKSAFTIGERAGRKALVRRVPLGVQVAGDSVMARSGRAGVRLAQAWEALYGIEPNPSEAYRLAILAVEDASVPVVAPQDPSSTLGKVLSQMEAQGNWKLPLKREHDKAPTEAVVIAQMRVLWHGQHDRHGGQPSAPGNVTLDEARVAVALSTALVSLFSDGLIARS